MANTTMSSPGYPQNMSNQQQPMQQPMQMGMSNQNMAQMVDAMSKMEQKVGQMATMQAQMQEMLIDQRNYIEQRDSWLETRMSQLDRRCQKVEVLSDRLHSLLRGFDVESLSAVPKEVTKALNTHLGNYSPDSSAAGSPTAASAKALRDLSSSSDDPSQPWGQISQDGAHPSAMVPHGQNHGHRDQNIKQDLKKMSQQLDLLVSSAEATPQMTRLLWRMDLNLRQLAGTASNVPQQNIPPPQSPDRSKPSRLRHQSPVQGNQTPQTAQAKSAAASGSGSGAASRQQSKLGGISEGGGGYSDV